MVYCKRQFNIVDSEGPDRSSGEKSGLFLLEVTGVKKKVVCSGCGESLEIEYETTREPQPAGFVHCPNCGEVIEGNERPSFRSIIVSLADLPEIEVQENPFWRNRH